ncbi:DoxX family protein [Rhodopirellula sallentina]|nr:DoxX family protein [Rhodopirellula sallentina]
MPEPDPALTSQPYHPPAMPNEDPSVDMDRTHKASLLPYAQLGVRLLGVMFFVDGLSSIFGGLIQNTFQTQAYAESGYDVAIDPHSAGWAAGGLPYLVAGLYLMVGGNWLLFAVFTSPSASETQDDPDDQLQRTESHADG